MTIIIPRRWRETWEGVPMATWCSEWICRTWRGKGPHMLLESSKQNYYIISFWAIIKAIFTSHFPASLSLPPMRGAAISRAPTIFHDDSFYTRISDSNFVKSPILSTTRLSLSLRRKDFLVQPIQHDHGARTPHWLIYVSPIYCACATAWSSTSGGTCLRRACVISRASSYGVCCCASSCVSMHTAQMVLFEQAMCIQAQVVQMWVVIILRYACICMRVKLRSRSGPLTRRSVTWIVLPSLLFLLTLNCNTL